MKKGFWSTAAAVGLLFSAGAQAMPQAYDISWSGRNNFSLSGMFSFDSSSGNIITAGELTGFMIEGFNNGSSLGIFTGVPELFTFNTAETRIQTLGQSWNIFDDAIGLGFGCALTACSLTNDGNLAFRSITPGSIIDVTPKIIETQALTAPAGLAALLAGLLAFAFRRRLATV